jgi:hypothetical protein
MGFLGEKDYEEEENNENIQDNEGDSEVIGEDGKFCGILIKVSDNLLKISEEWKNKNVSKDYIQSRLSQEIVNLLNAKDLLNAPHFDDKKK